MTPSRTPISTAPIDIETRLSLFHSLDFEAFNQQDWSLFGDLHTDDVIVELNGQRTVGIHSHIEVTKSIFDQNPDTQVVEHLITFGEGEWTCAVSRTVGMGTPETKVVTVARWRGDKVSEEYIFAA